MRAVKAIQLDYGPSEDVVVMGNGVAVKLNPKNLSLKVKSHRTKFNKPFLAHQDLTEPSKEKT